MHKLLIRAKIIYHLPKKITQMVLILTMLILWRDNFLFLEHNVLFDVLIEVLYLIKVKLQVHNF